ncbi:MULTISPECIES: hypothetical protein [unclassified Rhizobium]|uniref:hypothetical protein n=1 Tax=unclassified Rhizobium TaxID=2613769 RepID=UPI000DBFDECE|nr:hypothetical protein [Rhizobium sp. AN80A]
MNATQSVRGRKIYHLAVQELCLGEIVKADPAMKLIRGLTIAIIFCPVFGCSHQGKVVTKPYPAKDQVRMTSPLVESCRGKPNYEGMLRTLCY